MRKVLFLLLLLVIFGAASVSAQVRIGGDEAPNAAAVLDLNVDDTNTGTKGLALPRVNFSSNTAQITSGVPNLTGMLVYNTNTTLGVGVYYWDGSEWIKSAGGNIYTGSTSIVQSGTSFQRAELTGDVTAAENSNVTTITAGAVTTDKLASASVTDEKIAPGSISMASTKLESQSLSVTLPANSTSIQIPMPVGCTTANSWIIGSSYGTTVRTAIRVSGSGYVLDRAPETTPQTLTLRLFCFR